MIKERQTQQALGPGKYESPDRPEGYTKQISWNLGKVPFKSGAQRFENKWNVVPGPGQYNTLEVGGHRTSTSPRSKTNKPLPPSSQFVSKAPKVSIYKDEEKRI